MRVVVAHDWLVRYAGSERVVEAILDLYPGSRLLTTIVGPEGLPEGFSGAEPSFLQHVPRAASRHEVLLPLMPLAWRLRDAIDSVDVVVSSSHACAKAVRVAPGVPHVCYCHTPMRYAWMFEQESGRFPRIAHGPARVLMSAFRRWDRATAANVTAFVANSSAVATRIQRAYGRSAVVVHPPVRTDFFTLAGEQQEEVEDFFLYVGRLVSYKRPDAVVNLFSSLPDRLVVVGTGHLEAELRQAATANVTFVRDPTDEELRSLYRRARALVFLGNEDFGITLAEAQACGTPIVAARRGGALDIVDHGSTGWLVDPENRSEVLGAISDARSNPFDRCLISSTAQRFSMETFRTGLDAVVREVVA